MTNAVAPVRPIALADTFVKRSLVVDILFVVGGAALIGLLAQVAIPLWPVPITGQTLAVLLVGSALGVGRAIGATALYAALGVVGLPWFSDWSSGWHVLAGPTGGYIVGFVVAAAFVSFFSARSWGHTWLGAAVTFTGGSLIVFAFGLPWLAAALGLNLEQTLQAGLYPFIVGGVIKAAIAAALIPLVWKLSARVNRKSDD